MSSIVGSIGDWRFCWTLRMFAGYTLPAGKPPGRRRWADEDAALAPRCACALSGRRAATEELAGIGRHGGVGEDSATKAGGKPRLLLWAFLMSSQN
jgi:hypothetical protein